MSPNRKRPSDDLPTSTPMENLELLSIISPRNYRAGALLIGEALTREWAKLTHAERVDAVTTFDQRFPKVRVR